MLSTSGAVTVTDDENSKQATLHGLVISRPPWRVGSDMILRSFSLHTQSEMAGISKSEIAFSSGSRKT